MVRGDAFAGAPFITLRPANRQIGRERKDNGLAIHFGNDTRTFGRRGQAEAERRSEYRRVRFAYKVHLGPMSNLRLDEKRRGVRPGLRGDVEMPSISGQTLAIDGGKSTGTGNAGDAHVAELVAFSRVERD